MPGLLCFLLLASHRRRRRRFHASCQQATATNGRPTAHASSLPARSSFVVRRVPHPLNRPTRQPTHPPPLPPMIHIQALIGPGSIMRASLSHAAVPASPHGSESPRRSSSVFSPFGGGSPQQQQQRPDPEATARRWLEMSANRPKRHHAPERRRALAHHYHQAHQEILTVGWC